MERLRLDNSRVEWREVEGQIVALDTVSSQYLGINASGAAVWPKLAEGATRDELLARLTDRFDVDNSVAASDLDRFLGSLEERGLLIRESD